MLNAITPRDSEAASRGRLRNNSAGSCPVKASKEVRVIVEQQMRQDDETTAGRQRVRAVSEHNTYVLLNFHFK